MWNTYIVHMPGFEKRKQPTFFVVARLTKQDVKMSSCHLFFTIHFTLNQMLLPYKQPKVLRHHDTERWQIKGKHNNLSCFKMCHLFFLYEKQKQWLTQCISLSKSDSGLLWMLLQFQEVSSTFFQNPSTFENTILNSSAFKDFCSLWWNIYENI